MKYVQYEDDYGNLIVEFEDEEGYKEYKKYSPYREDGETKYRITEE